MSEHVPDPNSREPLAVPATWTALATLAIATVVGFGLPIPDTAGAAEPLALTADSLRKIANGLDGLAASGVKVDQFTVYGYRVRVRRQESQLDGTWYVVTGLEAVR